MNQSQNAKPALVVTELTKVYSNQVLALNGINITVRRGDFFALLGPNGAGKSTLISILTSLIPKTSGKVSIFNHDIDQNFSAAKKCLGVVPQEFNFNVFETVENILLAQAGYYGITYRQAKARVEYYLKQLYLWDKRHQSARSLSGGMKRRLMIARALVHKPKILILDEPSAGVDIEIRHATWKFLTALNQQGTTIILTTHYLEEAQHLCRNLAIINGGKIVASTSMEAILDQLDRECFILFLRLPVTYCPLVPGYNISLQSPTSLEVEVTKEQGVSYLLTELLRMGIDVVSLRNKSTKLEQVFLSLTSKRL